ncbi:MAG: hypothetical protein A2309_02975 [Bacteroidetes bacterium RIFOXYB2_FULL_35_7]|nr:MAG: hypothetical protein A2309_02975 [Bacteroidetes bacterium RIFOXYB2_FULL_35_7]OGF44852.1 MAG: hypothetical protein A2231_10225 [Candidatus Firestonebacteria bacterium RIFOXYA2_FULL_40_8]
MSPTKKKDLNLDIFDETKKSKGEIDPVIAKSDQKNNLFIGAEVVGLQSLDKTTLINANPTYCYRWKNKNQMAGKRSGYWLVLDKTHPEFKDLKVVEDHTPNETFYTIGDLILCCMHKDTHRQIINQKQENAIQLGKEFEEKSKATEERINKSKGKEKLTILNKMENDGELEPLSIEGV